MFIYTVGCLTKYHNDNEFHKGLNWRLDIDNWSRKNKTKTYNPALVFMKEITHTYDPLLCVSQNDYYINKSDIAIANLDDIDHSPGSQYELVRFKELRKPVISFGTRHWSPHINSCISHHCDNLEDALELLEIMFNQQ